MKYLLIVLLCLTTGCVTTKTEYGSCVGFADQKDPKLTYNYSGWNLFIAALLSETIIVPVFIAAKLLECPAGAK